MIIIRERWKNKNNKENKIDNEIIESSVKGKSEVKCKVSKQIRTPIWGK
jgi:hypothetical protein